MVAAFPLPIGGPGFESVTLLSRIDPFKGRSTCLVCACPPPQPVHKIDKMNVLRRNRVLILDCDDKISLAQKKTVFGKKLNECFMAANKVLS